MHYDYDEIDLGDLTPIEVPYTIGGNKYVLKEADGAAACVWRNALIRSTKIGPDGKPTFMDGIADTEPLLVSLCLFRVNPSTDCYTPVPLSQVRSWPARVIKTLFAQAKRISQLDEGEDTKDTLIEQMDRLRDKLAKFDSNGDTAKNSPISSTAGSAPAQPLAPTRSS